jgi:hypothetical protein
MKKLIYLFLGIVLLVVLGYYAYDLSQSAGTSDEKVAALDFDIKDTASIDRILITEPSGAHMELVRTAKGWTDKASGCVQQVPVKNILEAAYNIRFKGYVQKNAEKTVINRLATNSTEVQFFQDGEWSKTWYVGTSTPDHHGTYMLVESDANGKSDLPIIAEIKGMQGIISPRFFADPRRWMCTEIFSLGVKEIDQVTVKFTKESQRNFEVKRKGKGFSVSTNGRAFPVVDTAMIYRYLLNYKQIHFEFPNFDLTDKQVDSVKRSTPFCVLTVKPVKGQASKLKLFYRKSDNPNMDIDDFGNQVAYDINRFWCLMPNGELVKCQYFVFNPLIMGNIYFNYGTENPRPI